MTYTMAEPPFSVGFPSMTKQQLKEFFVWFQDVIPERLDVLIKAVHETPGFESWDPDFSPESLDGLGNWFAGEVETRQRSADEMAAIESTLKFPIEISTDELTLRTFSIALDIGIYLSQVFMKNYPNLEWFVDLRNKRHADYGRPALKGFRVCQFNPVRVAIVIAYGLADKSKDGSRLRDLYEVWRKDVLV